MQRAASWVTGVGSRRAGSTFAASLATDVLACGSKIGSHGGLTGSSFPNTSGCARQALRPTQYPCRTRLLISMSENRSRSVRMLGNCLCTSGCNAVGSCSGSTKSVIRAKTKPGSVLKRFILQLPDSVHEDVAGAHGSANESTGSQVAADFERFTHIADQHAIPRRLVCFRQLREEAKHADTEVVEDAAVGVRLSAEFTASRTNIRSGQLHRWKETGKRG